MICPVCKSQMNDGYLFCKNCGAPLKTVCAENDFDVNHISKFSAVALAVCVVINTAFDIFGIASNGTVHTFLMYFIAYSVPAILCICVSFVIYFAFLKNADKSDKIRLIPLAFLPYSLILMINGVVDTPFQLIQYADISYTSVKVISVVLCMIVDLIIGVPLSLALSRKILSSYRVFSAEYNRKDLEAGKFDFSLRYWFVPVAMTAGELIRLVLNGITDVLSNYIESSEVVTSSAVYSLFYHSMYYILLGVICFSFYMFAFSKFGKNEITALFAFAFIPFCFRSLLSNILFPVTQYVAFRCTFSSQSYSHIFVWLAELAVTVIAIACATVLTRFLLKNYTAGK
ncbi:MAG: hypothetical protein ACI4IE_07045 [Eubacterium sp.]